MIAKQKVLILGAGFGGIKAALQLSGSSRYAVTLLSDGDDFRYYPTLYRTATGKSHESVVIPLKEIFENHRLKIVKETAETLDRNNKKVKCRSGKSYEYDILIVALGVVTNFFGIKGLEENSFGIKTIEEAQELRDHLHKLMLDQNKPDLNYVIIGGGPTGVELAGALPSYLRHIMDKHNIKSKNFHVDLVEAADRLMGRMPVDYSKAVAKRLRKLGVKLYLGQKVEGATAEEITVSGHEINSHTVVWTAGVTNHPFLSSNEFVITGHGKCQVNEYLQAEEHIYVIGDNADTEYSGLAQTALHDAVFVSRNLKRLAAGQEPEIYKPRRPIYVTPAGPRWAAVQWGSVRITGLIGWLMRDAADLVAYHDFEPWWKASQHFAARNRPEETCEICLQQTT